MKRKVFKGICLLMAVMLLVFATGCAPQEAEKKDTAPTKAPEKQVVIMGTNAEFPPFEFITENGIVGEYAGIDVGIAAEIAKALGKELKVENMVFDSLIPALQTGKIDFIAAGMTIKEDRRQNVDFTDTYFEATQNIIVNNNSAIAKADDLKGKKIGVVLGYTGDTIVSDMDKETGNTMKIERYKKGTDAVMDLINGKLDAVVIDSYPANIFAKKNATLKIVTDSMFEKEEYAIAVKKGNTELLGKINEVLKTLKENGKIEELFNQYNEN